MKKTKKSVLFFVLQIVFSLVVPVVLVWIQYGGLAYRYKISVTAIVLLIIVFLIFKKVMLNRWLKAIDSKIIQIETNSLSITGPSAIETNKKAWRTYSLIQSIINYILPILIFALALITIEKIEAGLIKLYGVAVLSMVSFVFGMLFRWAEIYSMRLPHEKVNNEERTKNN